MSSLLKWKHWSAKKNKKSAIVIGIYVRYSFCFVFNSKEKYINILVIHFLRIERILNNTNLQPVTLNQHFLIVKVQTLYIPTRLLNGSLTLKLFEVEGIREEYKASAHAQKQTNKQKDCSKRNL